MQLPSTLSKTSPLEYNTPSKYDGVNSNKLTADSVMYSRIDSGS